MRAQLPASGTAGLARFCTSRSLWWNLAAPLSLSSGGTKWALPSEADALAVPAARKGEPGLGSQR